jgi:hypothetical protein
MTTPSSDSDFRVYLFSYRYDGAEWSFEVPAKDEQDAKLRVARMYYATLDGELVAKVPVQFGLFVRLYVFLRNWIRAVSTRSNQNGGDA